MPQSNSKKSTRSRQTTQTPLRNEQTVKTEMKKAISDYDLLALLRAGFDNFMRLLFERPISFQEFLRYTGEYFDQFVLDTCEKETLTYAGGKLLLALDGRAAIQMKASFYFQDAHQKWILKEKQGHIEASNFRDWETAPKLVLLRQRGTLEYPIDPPEETGA